MGQQARTRLAQARQRHATWASKAWASRPRTSRLTRPRVAQYSALYPSPPPRFTGEGDCEAVGEGCTLRGPSVGAPPPPPTAVPPPSVNGRGSPICGIGKRAHSALTMTPSTPHPAPMRRVLETFLVFLGTGPTSFGGPVAHLGYFSTMPSSSRRKWLSDADYADLVALCNFLPARPQAGGHGHRPPPRRSRGRPRRLHRLHPSPRWRCSISAVLGTSSGPAPSPRASCTG